MDRWAATTQQETAMSSGAKDVDPRYALFVAHLAARLRPVCAGWDEAEFQALVQRIARMKVRWGDAYRPWPIRADALPDDASGRHAPRAD
jgi:hypothetical protein